MLSFKSDSFVIDDSSFFSPNKRSRYFVREGGKVSTIKCTLTFTDDSRSEELVSSSGGF